MSLFLKLSVTLLTEVLCEWCSMIEIVKLDSAVCSVKERVELLHFFASQSFSVSGHFIALKPASSQSRLKYCQLRKIKLRVLDISEEIENNSFEMLLDLSSLSQLSINFTTLLNLQSASNIINRTKRLKSLHLLKCKSEEEIIKTIESKIFSNLTELNISRDGIKDSVEIIDKIIQNCSNLKNLHLAMPGVIISEENLISIISNNPLERLQVYNTDYHLSDKVLDTFLMHSAYLQEVYMLWCEQMTFKAIGNFVSSCPKLIKLFLYSEATRGHHFNYAYETEPYNLTYWGDKNEKHWVLNTNEFKNDLHSSDKPDFLLDFIMKVDNLQSVTFCDIPSLVSKELYNQLVNRNKKLISIVLRGCGWMSHEQLQENFGHTDHELRVRYDAQYKVFKSEKKQQQVPVTDNTFSIGPITYFNNKKQ